MVSTLRWAVGEWKGQRSFRPIVGIGMARLLDLESSWLGESTDSMLIDLQLPIRHLSRQRVSRICREMDSNAFSRATERLRCNSQVVQKQDRKEQEEVYGTISNDEWNKMVEETLRKDKKLLEKLAQI